jgi:hypothetical protein
MSTVRACFWLEAGLAALCGALALLTAFAHTWIETVTGLDPDHRNGSLEWAIVAALLLACLAAGAAARAEWRRPAAATVSGG